MDIKDYLAPNQLVAISAISVFPVYCWYQQCHSDDSIRRDFSGFVGSFHTERCGNRHSGAGDCFLG